MVSAIQEDFVLEVKVHVQYESDGSDPEGIYSLKLIV